MFYSEVITAIREELSDVDKTEWNDVSLMSFISRAEKRIHEIIVLNALNFARKHSTIELVADQLEYLLPQDFGVQAGLFSLVDGRQLMLVTSTDWYKYFREPPGPGIWRLMDGQIMINSTDEAGSNLELCYFPAFARNLDPNAEIPYGDYIFDSVLGYAALIAKNVDEMDVQADVRMLADIEINLVKMYGRNEPQTTTIIPGGV